MFARSRSLVVLVAPIFFELSFMACDESRRDDRSTVPNDRADAGADRELPMTIPSARNSAGPPCHLRPWAPPRRVAIEGVSASLETGSPALTPDELSIVFQVRKPDDGGAGYELWAANRATRADAFSKPERLSGAGSDADDAYPSLTSDGITLVFVSRRLDEAGPYKLFRAERPDVLVSFSAARPIAAADAGAGDWPVGSASYPFLTRDRTTLYFASDQEGDGALRIYRSERLASSTWQPPVREDSIDDAASSLAFVMSVDHTTLFVSRADGEGRYRIHSAVRPDIDARFGPLSPVDALNAGAVDARLGWLSADGCRAYLTRRSEGADGGVAIYTSEREP